MPAPARPYALSPGDGQAHWFYGNLVTVTGGGTAGGIELKVVPK